ncbi:hypothetical protein CYMTET_55186 [Cymbomonas tetramitiformis]|uniref:Uncharacterized protein n=1 Tax=Cymbomonas tetramitiformis TaxID=36881 RepID=A0AAE0ENA5_9CHLO|nr:hypothetical protein CYMTET_55186 [Cymbomonas tetramitiformis]|eukprot:gene106-155_t
MYGIARSLLNSRPTDKNYDFGSPDHSEDSLSGEHGQDAITAAPSSSRKRKGAGAAVTGNTKNGKKGSDKQQSGKARRSAKGKEKQGTTVARTAKGKKKEDLPVVCSQRNTPQTEGSSDSEYDTRPGRFMLSEDEDDDEGDGDILVQARVSKRDLIDDQNSEEDGVDETDDLDDLDEDVQEAQEPDDVVEDVEEAEEDEDVQSMEGLQQQSEVLVDQPVQELLSRLPYERVMQQAIEKYVIGAAPSQLRHSMMKMLYAEAIQQLRTLIDDEEIVDVISSSKSTGLASQYLISLNAESSESGSELKTGIWSRYPPASVTRGVIEEGTDSTFSYYQGHIRKQHAAAVIDFLRDRVLEDTSLPNPSEDVVTYETSITDFLKLVRICEADLHDISMTFPDCDNQSCLFTSSQVATIYLATTMDQSNFVTGKISIGRVDEFLKQYDSKQNTLKERFGAGEQLQADAKLQYDRIVKVDYKKLAQSLKSAMKDSNAVDQLYVQTGYVQPTGRIVKFVNLPAGGGKTHVSIEICFVLLSLRCLRKTLNTLPLWSSVITSAGGNSFSLVGSFQQSAFVRAMLRACIIVVDRNNIDAWRVILELKQKSKPLHKLSVRTVKTAEDLDSLSLDLERCVVDMDATDSMLQNSRGMILLCEVGQLQKVMKVVGGRSFAAMVVDDPKGSHVGAIDPICRNFFFLSANPTEFLASLSLPCKAGKEHIVDRTESMFKNLIPSYAKYVEKSPLDIREALLSPEGGLLKPESVARIKQSVDANVYRAVVSTMPPCTQEWTIRDMSRYMPSTVTVFPMCTKREHGFGRPFFSNEKLYVDHETFDVFSAYKDSKLVPLVVKQSQFWSVSASVARKTVLSDLQQFSYVTEVKKPEPRSGAAPSRKKVSESEYVVHRKAQWYSAPMLFRDQKNQFNFVKWYDDAHFAGKTFVKYSDLFGYITDLKLEKNVPKALPDLPTPPSASFPGAILKSSLMGSKHLKTVDEKDVYACMCCAHLFTSNEFLQSSIQHFSAILCPNCAIPDQGFDEQRSIAKDERPLLRAAEKYGEFTLEQLLAHFRGVCNDNENFPVAQHLVDMVGALLMCKEVIMRRFIVYVSDRNRHLLLLCMKLLEEEYSVSFREFVEQNIACPYTAQLLGRSQEEPASTRRSSGRSAKGKANASTTEQDTRLPTLAWFNTVGSDSGVRFLIVSSDSRGGRDEVYGIDARGADCSIFVNTPESCRVQAVARGLRMSACPSESHLIIQL